MYSRSSSFCRTEGWTAQSTVRATPPDTVLSSFRLLTASGRAWIAVRLEDDLPVLHPHRVGADGFRGFRNGPARGDLELPGVPGTAHDLPLPHPEDVVGAGVLRRARDLAQTQRPARMRTVVVERVVLPVDVEHAHAGAAGP